MTYCEAGDGGGDEDTGWRGRSRGGLEQGGESWESISSKARVFVSWQGLGRKQGTYNLQVLNTLLTFKSITFAKALSGCVSNASPHVAPAFANSMST